MIESVEAKQCKQHATKIRKQVVIHRVRAGRYSRTQQVSKPQSKKQNTTDRVTAKLGNTEWETIETHTSRQFLNHNCMHSPACSRWKHHMWESTQKKLSFTTLAYNLAYVYLPFVAKPLEVTFLSSQDAAHELSAAVTRLSILEYVILHPPCLLLCWRIIQVRTGTGMDEDRMRTV